MGVLRHPEAIPVCIYNHRAFGEGEPPWQAGPLEGGTLPPAAAGGHQSCCAGSLPGTRGGDTLPAALPTSSTASLPPRLAGKHQIPTSSLHLHPYPEQDVQSCCRKPWQPLICFVVLQLGRLRAHRLLRAAVHPGEGRVPALGRLERQQCLPHRAPDVLPPRLLRCECPGCNGALATLILLKCPRH